jgi:hypothetical protein
MGMSYTIDQGRRIVLARAWGVISTQDVQDVSSRILADPAFHSTYSSLTDLSDVTDVTVDRKVLAATASVPLFEDSARRAFVAPSDIAFGMARMFATLAERSGREVRVFRELHLAEAWLGL